MQGKQMGSGGEPTKVKWLNYISSIVIAFGEM